MSPLYIPTDIGWICKNLLIAKRTQNVSSGPQKMDLEPHKPSKSNPQENNNSTTTDDDKKPAEQLVEASDHESAPGEHAEDVDDDVATLLLLQQHPAEEAGARVGLHDFELL